MGNYTHLLLVKFNEGVLVEDIAKEIEKLVSEISVVDSFVWGKDDMNTDTSRKDFTHAFLMTFKSKEDLLAYCGHKKHVEFATTFQAAIESALIFDFPAITVKAAAPADTDDADADDADADADAS